MEKLNLLSANFTSEIGRALPPRSKKGAYNDTKSVARRRFIPERY